MTRSDTKYSTIVKMAAGPPLADRPLTLAMIIAATGTITDKAPNQGTQETRMAEGGPTQG